MRFAVAVVVAVFGSSFLACSDDDKDRHEDDEFSYVIDAARLTPFSPTATVRPGSESKLGAFADAAGVQSTVIVDEIVVRDPAPGELDALLERTGGVVVATDEVPAPPEGLARPGIDPSYLAASTYTIKISVLPEVATLDANARARGVRGERVFDSDDTARLFSLVSGEKAAGMHIGANYVADMGAVLLTAKEEATTPFGVEPVLYRNILQNPYFYQTGDGTSRATVTKAWQYMAAHGFAPSSVKVAVVDGGFDLDPATGLYVDSGVDGGAPEMPHAAWQYDFYEDDTNAAGANPNKCTGGSSCASHGAHCASVIAGALDNKQGAAGTGTQVADPVLFRAHLNSSQLARVFKTLVAWDIDVASLSFGMPCNSDCREDKSDEGYTGRLSEALDQGVIIVAAAGNDDRLEVSEKSYYPCVIDRVICVGALDDGTNNRIDYSNYGARVDTFAPTNIPVKPTQWYVDTIYGDGLASAGGTSASTPYVAGIAALMKAVNPGLTGPLARDIINATDYVGQKLPSPDPDVALSGYFNAHAAVVRAAGDTIALDALESNDTLATATQVTGASFTANDLTIGESPDHYRVVMPDFGTIKIDITNAARTLGHLAITMTDGAGQSITAPTTGGSNLLPSGRSWSRSVAPGTYDLALVASQLQGYNVNITTSIIAILPDAFEANETVGAAKAFQYYFNEPTLHEASPADVDFFTFPWPWFMSGTEKAEVNIFAPQRPVHVRLTPTNTLLAPVELSGHDITFKPTWPQYEPITMEVWSDQTPYATNYWVDVYVTEVPSNEPAPIPGYKLPILWKQPTLAEIHTMTGPDAWVRFDGFNDGRAKAVRLTGEGLRFDVYDFATGLIVATSEPQSDLPNIQDALTTGWMREGTSFAMHVTRVSALDPELASEDLPVVTYSIETVL